MRIIKIVITEILVMFMIGVISFVRAEPVEYKVIGSHEYQSFVKNWNSKKHPVLYALIRNPGEWDAVFHPAPIMRVNRPFGPDEKLYDKKQILVVSRVAKPSSILKVQKVCDNNDELALHYSFTARNLEASFTIKEYFAVVIPKRNYKTIAFIENGKHTGTLNIAKGQWSVPALRILSIEN